jgi:hypothetical protein
VNIETRLAEILAVLDGCGMVYLVMGGHAARYYGVERTTADYDLHVSLRQWEELDRAVGHLRSLARIDVQEGPSWRPHDFRRFLIGRLTDGREEWLEFWRANHLLAPFAELYARREEGDYGGRAVCFLSLVDLIRSKETERESDWQDIAVLEEIQDARNLARAVDRSTQMRALAQLRSRKGLRAVAASDFLTSELIEESFAASESPLTRACLSPWLSKETLAIEDAGIIGEILRGPLRKVDPGSAKHLALVEAVRRLYKQAAMARDREDKMKALRQPECT